MKTNILINRLIIQDIAFAICIGWLLCCAIPIFAQSAAADSSPSTPTLQAAADHHVHMLSTKLIADWKSLGMPFSRTDEHYNDPAVILEKMGIQQACVVSMAHLYSSRWFGRIVEKEEQEIEFVTAENDYIVRSVGKFPDRLVGYYSLHPTRDHIVRLRDQYRNQPGMIGWKMHLPACGVDLGNPDELKKLQEVFAWCSENQQSILIHLFSGDEPIHLAERFWTLVEPHPELEVILAHCGTSGGYNDLPHALLSGFQALVERNPKFAQAPVFFDLSGAVLLTETEGLAPTSDDNCRRLATTMRTVGLNRFLYASDYPVFSATDISKMLQEKLELTKPEIEQILSNRSRALRQLEKR